MQNPVLPWVEYMYVDNYYVKILTENGIVGVTAFGMMLLGLVGNGLRACVRTAKTRWSPLCAGMLCGLIGVLIHSVFESIWEEPYMMALFFAVAAMLAWAGLLRRRSAGNRLTEAYSCKNAVKYVGIPTDFAAFFIFLAIYEKSLEKM